MYREATVMRRWLTEAMVITVHSTVWQTCYTGRQS